MEVETSIIKDETVRTTIGGRGGSSVGAAGQHHNRRSYQKIAPPIPIPVGNATVTTPGGTTVTVRVGLNMNMCRLCLAEGTASTRLQPVYYTKDTPDEALLQRILELTTIQVTYATDFPSSVCIGCRSKLEEYYHFRRQCIENDEILKIKYYEIKAAEDYHREQQQQQQQQHQQQLQQQSQAEQVEDAKGEEFIDDGDDITLAIDESAEVEEYQEETEEDEGQQPQPQQQQHHQQVVEQQTIQYADGTMAEYVEATPADDVRTVSNSSQQQQIHISGYSETEGTIQAAEGHEIYYTDGTDTYAIHTTTEGYVNAANYVPQGYDNQTEIECTTIEHLPEEEVYMDEGGSVGTIITPRGVHDRPYVCKHCKTSFKYEYNYERHMKNHAKVLYRCGKCSKTFTKQRKCQQHFLKAHSSQRYECDICFRTYSLPTRLENHIIEMHSENGVYKCDRCTETFTSYLEFKSHRNSHHANGGPPAATVIAQATDQPPQEPSPQPTPSRTATSVSTRSSVSDSCDFENMIDETKIVKPSATAEPATQPTAEKRPEHQDLACLEEETSAASSRKQAKISPAAPPSTVVVKNTTPPTSSTVITNGIDKNSLHRQLLQQIEESEATSTGPKIYKCDSCVKTFVHLNNLKAHIYAEHDNDKPFKCKLCPISFKTKEILVMHMVLHSQHNTTT